jgi:hypothetical protein
MWTKLRIVLFTLLALATAVILSCAPPPVSIDDRLASFITSLNGNRSDTYTNCDPNAGNYGASKTPNYWDTAFNPPGATFSLVPGYNTNNPSSVVITINKNGAFYDTDTFNMVNDKNAGSDNWLIHSITSANVGSVF